MLDFLKNEDERIPDYIAEGEDINNKKINITFTYPRDDKYDYFVTNAIINLDEECLKDLSNGQGFIIREPQAINKTIKSEFLQSLNGNQNLKQIQHKYIRLVEQINEFKEGLNDDYLNESFPIDCSLFFIKFKGLDMEKTVSNYNKNCYPEWIITEYGRDINDQTIFFPYKIIGQSKAVR